MGWFDHLDSPERIPSMRSSAMNVVMPYGRGPRSSVDRYLDSAHRQKMKVFVQVDPTAVITVNPALVRAFVELHKKHPAVAGWLLIDEPTLHDEYRLVTPSRATMLYRQIKAADPRRPVGIAFGVTENPRPYLPAMDVLMYDDYVQGVQTSEFEGLGRWRARLMDRAKIASKLQGYMPILQAFGQDSKGRPQINKRLPTYKEMRYLTYTATQYDATGLFFWVRYRSRPDWIARVLTPLSREIAPALNAMARGPISGAKPAGSSVRTTLFQDPSTKVRYLVVVHHGDGTVTPTIYLRTSFKTTRVWSKHSEAKVSGGKFVDEFGPYSARMYRLYS